MASSRLDIDLSSIERNVTLVRGMTVADEPRRRVGGGTGPVGGKSSGGGGGGGVSICAVLKQDAYGAGAVRVGKRLAASGVDMLSVYTLEEARVLADAISNVPILVLMPVLGIDRHDPLYRHAASGRIHLTVHGLDQLTAVSETAARVGIPMPLHVQVDTGLSRGGSAPEEAVQVLERVLNSGKLRLAGLMTHFASPCCDEAFTREQARVFREYVEHVKPAIRSAVASQARVVGGQAAIQDIALHAANSCAAFRSRSLHGSMVRVGQAMYGYLMDDESVPADFEFSTQAGMLEPALRWTSHVAHVQEIPAGWPVGYGSIWRAPYRADGRKTRIAIVPVGYADGYPRSLSGIGGVTKGVVGFTGRLWERRGNTSSGGAGGPGASEIVDPAFGSEPGGQAVVYAPVVGRVSMDQITVDVTDVPAPYLRFGQIGTSTETVGSEVELYGRRRGTPNFIGAMAREAGTITHELLCRIGARVDRVYRVQATSTGHSGDAVVRTTASGTMPGQRSGSGGAGGAGGMSSAVA